MQKNLESRRLGALQRLESAKFFPKVGKDGKARTKETWEKRRENEIKTLKSKVRVD